MSETMTYSVPGMHCGHGTAAFTQELEADVDLDSKRVTFTGLNLDDAALRAAIDEAGYDVAV